MNEILIKSIVDKYLMDNVPSGKLIDDIDYEDGEINILYTNGDADFFEIEIPTPKDGENGKDGKDGKDYVLTQQDKEQIAREITVPIVEKVIEKTEIIKEVPIITNEIKEVAKYETPKEIVKKIESLEGQDRLSAKSIKGLEEFMVEGPRTGASSLTSLTDTNIVNPIDGQTLFYNQLRSQRENRSGLGGGGVQSVVAGTGIVVDNTDPSNPIISSDKDRWHYIGKVFYTENDTTIAGGDVLECEYGATTIYRYITNTNDANGYPTQDAFYGSFDGTNLTSLITTRG